MRKWSLGQLTVVGVRPFELVEIAARAGYDAVDPLVGLVDFPEIPTVPLKAGDPDTIRMAEALKANGIAFNVADAFVLNAQTDLEAVRRMVDLVAEMGAKSVNAIHFDDDRPRGFANLAALDAMAREAGLPVVIEYLKFSQIGTAQEALEAIAAIGSGNMGLMCDPLHHFFVGGTTEEMHGYTGSILAAQLCDGPADPSFEEYVRMAMGDRMLPGDGALPLVGFMAALPPGLMCAIEVPLPAEKDLLKRATMALEAGKAVDR